MAIIAGALIATLNVNAVDTFSLPSGLPLRLEDVETMVKRLADAGDDQTIDARGICRWSTIEVPNDAILQYQHFPNRCLITDVYGPEYSKLRAVIDQPSTLGDVVNTARAYRSLLETFSSEKRRHAIARIGFPLDPAATGVYLEFTETTVTGPLNPDDRAHPREIDHEYRQNRLSLFDQLVTGRIALVASQLAIVDRHLRNDATGFIRYWLSAPAAFAGMPPRENEKHIYLREERTEFVMPACGLSIRMKRWLGHSYAPNEKVIDFRDGLTMFGASLSRGEFVFYRPATDTLTGKLSSNSLIALQNFLFAPLDIDEETEIARALLDVIENHAEGERVGYVMDSGLHLGFNMDPITDGLAAAMEWHSKAWQLVTNRERNDGLPSDLRVEAANKLLADLLAESMKGLAERVRVVDAHKLIIGR